MALYSEVRPNLKSGDIILTQGTSIFSWAIRKATGSQYSHVGMVLRSDEIDTVLLWQSTTSGHKGDRTNNGDPEAGVQLVNLSKYVKDYDGGVFYRPMSRPLNDHEKAQLADFRKKVGERDYDYNALELIRSAVDLGIGSSNREDLQAFFCSELIAETFQQLGLLPSQPPANEYTPAGFAGEPELDGVSLGEVQELRAG